MKAGAFAIHAGAAGDAARPLRPLLPLRRYPRRARRHPVADHRAGAGRTAARPSTASSPRCWRSPKAAPRPGAPSRLPARELPGRRRARPRGEGLPMQPPLADRGPALTGADARLASCLPHRPQGRLFRSGALSAPARREHRFPQVRRRPAHDARLHAGARRPDRGAACAGRGSGHAASACTARTPP